MTQKTKLTLVARLRGWPYPDMPPPKKLLVEAADEIERLEREMELLRKYAAAWKEEATG